MPLTDEQKKLMQEAETRAVTDSYQPDYEHVSAGLGRRPIPTGPILPMKNDVRREVSRAAATIAKRSLQERAIVNKDGSLKPCFANAADLLRMSPDWTDVLGFDEFSQLIVTKRATPWGKPAGARWNDRDDGLTLEWMQRAGVLIQSSKQVSAAVDIVAHENPFHPVREYVRSLAWDGVERLPFWLRDYFGAQDSPFVRAVSSRWLISAIARAFVPGVQVDHTLLIEGSQGLGKSSGLRALFRDEWFAESLSVLGSKDSRMEIRGKWCAEIAELSALRRAQIEDVKTYLSTRTDTLRDPYNKRVGDVPRQNIFCATTNSACSLADETGNRRFWPVRCRGKVRVQELTSVRNSLFAEAFAKYQKCAPWWIDTAELGVLARQEQDARYVSGQWDDIISSWLENPQAISASDAPFYSRPGRIVVAEVLEHCIRKQPGQWTLADSLSVVRYLVHAGNERKRVKIGNARPWVYVPKDAE
jgi:predicted P-loop ATPase